MEQKKELSNFQILMKGQMHVNLPVTLIIFACLFVLTAYIDLSYRISVLIGLVLGWIYWSYSVRKWIKWAVEENNVDQDRLYKIGKNGLLLWNKDHITQVIENKKKPWI